MNISSLQTLRHTGIVLFLTFLTVGITFGAPAKPELHAFESGSLQQIVENHADRPFLLVLWSVECPPCHKEMGELAKILDQKGLQLIMVSTDSIDAAPEITRVLAKHGLGDIESWAFAGDNAQKLRFEIDPAWYGETPRSYFYDRFQNRTAVSGALDVGQIDSWLKLNTP
ncbi:MAG: TlpA family protein disulfide reductase [Gammaproteobacteria bacterium]